MATHRIRIVETTTMRGSAAFSVEAETVELAAAQVLTAYRDAVADGHTNIRLANGQSALIELDEKVGVAIRIEEIDVDKAVLREIDQAVIQRGMN